MAQTFSYKFLHAVPLPKGFKDGTGEPASLVTLSCTGPATSVGAGMTIASLSTDLTTISGGWIHGSAAHNIGFQFVRGTADAVASAKIHATRFSTGAQLSNAVNLTSYNFLLTVLGRGPLASAVD